MLSAHAAASVRAMSPSQLRWLCAIILKNLTLATPESKIMGMLHRDAQASALRAPGASRCAPARA